MLERPTIQAVAKSYSVAWRFARTPLAVSIVVQVMQSISVLALVFGAGAIADLLSEDVGIRAALIAISGLVLYLIATSTLEAAFDATSQYTSEVVNGRMTGALMEAMCHVPYEWFESEQRYDELTYASVSSRSAFGNLVQQALTVTSAGLTSLVAVATIAVLEWRLLPVVAVGATPSLLAALRSGLTYPRYLKQIASVTREQGLFYDFANSKAGAAEVRILGLAKLLRERWSALESHRLNLLRMHLRRRARLSLLSSTAGAVTAGIALALVAVVLSAGSNDVSRTVAVVGALLIASQRLQVLWRSAGQLAGSQEQAVAVQDVLQAGRRRDLGQPRSREGIDAPTGKVLLELKDVSYAYPGAEKYALREVDLEVRSGDRVLISGSNGAGKSTLIGVLLGLLPPTSGQYVFRGRVMSAAADAAHIWRDVSCIIQEFARFPTSVKDNVWFGDLSQPRDDAQVRLALRRAGLMKPLQDSGRDISSVVTPQLTDGSDLSTGQWQRLAIARGFFRKRPILIMDEPSAAIDQKGVSMLLHEVFNGDEYEAVVMITHRETVAGKWTKHVRVAEGTVEVSSCPPGAAVTARRNGGPTNPDGQRFPTRGRPQSGDRP